MLKLLQLNLTIKTEYTTFWKNKAENGKKFKRIPRGPKTNVA